MLTGALDRALHDSQIKQENAYDRTANSAPAGWAHDL